MFKVFLVPAAQATGLFWVREFGYSGSGYTVELQNAGAPRTADGNRMRFSTRCRVVREPGLQPHSSHEQQRVQRRYTFRNARNSNFEIASNLRRLHIYDSGCVPQPLPSPRTSTFLLGKGIYPQESARDLGVLERKRSKNN